MSVVTSGILTGPAITAGIDAAALGIQFATVETGTQRIGGGIYSLPEQDVKVKKPFGIATTPFTNQQLRGVLAQLGRNSWGTPKDTVLMGHLPNGKLKLLARGTEERIEKMSRQEIEEAIRSSVTLDDLRNFGGGMTVFDVQNMILTDAVPIVLREHCGYKRHGLQFREEKKPATEISWYGAAALALLLKSRLLSEIEWEVVARGKECREYPTPNGQLLDAFGRKQGHYDEERIANVGSYPPIQIGGMEVFDLLGNVWEWTGSWYEVGQPYRVLRGGSWNNKFPEFLRASCRNFSNPKRRSRFIGFRLAVDLS